MICAVIWLQVQSLRFLQVKLSARRREPLPTRRHFRPEIQVTQLRKPGPNASTHTLEPGLLGDSREEDNLIAECVALGVGRQHSL